MFMYDASEKTHTRAHHTQAHTHVHTQGELNERNTWAECGAILPELVEHWRLLRVKTSFWLTLCQNPFPACSGEWYF